MREAVADTADRSIAARLREGGLMIWLSFALIGAYGNGLASAEDARLTGYWQEPSGAVIQVARCTEGLCLTIVALSSGDHPRVDVHNPDVKLRGRPLCGLRIGQDFTQSDSHHADGGHLYDPKSGRTYSGSMTAEGDTLNLRGYLGIKLLGRTETWTRVGQAYPKCMPG